MAVGLEWLEISRCDVSLRSSDADATNNSCVRMLFLGAVWWTRTTVYDERMVNLSGITISNNSPPNFYIGDPCAGDDWCPSYLVADQGLRTLLGLACRS